MAENREAQREAGQETQGGKEASGERFEDEGRLDAMISDLVSQTNGRLTPGLPKSARQEQAAMQSLQPERDAEERQFVNIFGEPITDLEAWLQEEDAISRRNRNAPATEHLPAPAAELVSGQHQSFALGACESSSGVRLGAWNRLGIEGKVMKFIKDIIGERRDRVQHDGLQPEASAFHQPKPDTGLDHLAENDDSNHGPQAPLRLDTELIDRRAGGKTLLHLYWLQTAETPWLKAGWRPVRRKGMQIPTVQILKATSRQNLLRRTPKEDAIAAFFAREQPQPAGESEPSDEIEDTCDNDGPVVDGFETLSERPFNSAGSENDFSRLEDFEGAGKQGPSAKPYRIFSRRLKPEAEIEADSVETASISFASSTQVGQAGQVNTETPSSYPLKDFVRPEPSAARASGHDTVRSEEVEQTAAVAAASEPIDVPAPSMGRGASRAGRVKTRLLGFSHGQETGADPFLSSAKKAEPGYTEFPVGWLTVVKGPGRGAAFTLFKRCDSDWTRRRSNCAA